MINKKDKSIWGPMEFYYATRDEGDFLETVQLLIQAQNKKAALQGKKPIS